MDRARLALRLRMRCIDFMTGRVRPPRRVEAPQRPDMSWTCPDCRVRHETAIDPAAEAGRIVEVNCRACGTRHEASVFFRLRRPGTARMIVGVVWL